MTRSRGYHSYRGRTPKWKAALAVVLVLVILGAVGFMVLQEHIVYDGTGTPHLRLPQQETEDTGNAPEEEESVEVVIQEPEGPQEIHAFSLPAQALTQQTVETALAQPQAECNAVAVTLKDDAGLVYFDAAGAVSGTVRTEEDTTAALATLTGQEDLYTVARISCFHDPKAANAEVEKDKKKKATSGDWIFLIGLSLLVSALSQMVGGAMATGLDNIGLSMFDTGTCTTVFVTILGLICALSPLGKLPAVEELSNIYLYAVVSLLASTASLTDLVSAPMWVVYGVFILVIHVVLMFVLSKVFHWDLCMVSTASLANIGGSASAPIVATAYDASFAGIGVLMGVLGAAIGNFCGLGMGGLLQIFL